MDRAVESLIKTLEDTSKNEDGSFKISQKERLEAMAVAERWLLKRQKLLPDQEDDEGVNLIRQMIADPKNVVKRLKDDAAFIAALEDLEWIRPPERLKGRPTAVQAAHRAHYDAEKAARAADKPPVPTQAPEAASAGWKDFNLPGAPDA